MITLWYFPCAGWNKDTHLLHIHPWYDLSPRNIVCKCLGSER